mmetsp:Transcript_93917/g.201592  ORF Transcript_93917/g.201592 Transcript_93917/m.201592 type:complete len:126 (-) Transcript_93917:66-443(-)
MGCCEAKTSTEELVQQKTVGLEIAYKISVCDGYFTDQYTARFPEGVAVGVGVEVIASIEEAHGSCMTAPREIKTSTTSTTVLAVDGTSIKFGKHANPILYSQCSFKPESAKHILESLDVGGGVTA